MAGRPPSNIKRIPLNTRLDPDVLQALKKRSMEEFGTSRKVYLLIERWVKRDLINAKDEKKEVEMIENVIFRNTYESEETYEENTPHGSSVAVLTNGKTILAESPWGSVKSLLSNQTLSEIHQFPDHLTVREALSPSCWTDLVEAIHSTAGE